MAVTGNLKGLGAALKQALPHADIQVEGLGEGLVLYGNVSSPQESQTAFDIAVRLVDDSRRVVNNINIHGRDQVMLKVTVAEMQREIIKQLGIDLSGSLGSGATVVNFNSTNTFTALGQTLTPSSFTGSWKTVNATLRAMERAGVVRTLAEPTLSAISGESANFLVGGEFPIPGNYTCDPQTRSCQ